MPCLPSDTSETSGIKESTPSLQEETLETDADLYAINGACGYSDEPTCKNQTDIETIVDILVSALLQFFPKRKNIFELKDSAFLNPKALHAMTTVWKEIRFEKKDLLESKVIIQGVAKSMIKHMYGLELMVPQSEEETKETLAECIENIIAKYWQQILDEIKKEDEQEQAVKMREKQQSVRERLRRQNKNTNETDCQIDTENVVEKLFSAWLKFPPRRANVSKHKDSAFLCPKALHAMSTAWKQIKAENKDLPESEVIVQRLAKCMVNYIFRLESMIPDNDDEIKSFTEHVENIVSRCWQQILDEIEKEDERQRSVEMRERRQRIRQRLRRQREIAYTNWFYESFAKMDPEKSGNCRIFSNLLRFCSSKIMMQILIHTIFLAWPISIGAMGGMYLKLCPMSDLMLYAMIAIGFAGTLAILTRLSFAMFENISGTQITKWWPFILVKILEFVLLLFIIIQLYCFFSNTPSVDHGSSDYCNETFYKFVLWINYVSIAVSSMLLFVYFIKIIPTWNLTRFSIRSK